MSSSPAPTPLAAGAPVPVRLYDSLRRAKVPFEPLRPGEVGMYVCGPTPYAPAHIGHAFSAISFDTIRRALICLGYRVTYVRNITDVEDKIIKRANEVGEDPMALAARFAADYNRDMACFGVLAPDVEPKVSTHIAEIIALIETLVAKGHAYAVEGDVYYACETFAPYGRLSGQSLEDLRAGARVEVDERKASPADFALWKAAKPGEPFWESPRGKGRPGWHIECSAMTEAHLGVTFDLHGGGKDLIFPHHENEIAQSQGAHGEDTFARHWLHNGFLNFGGVKMSKSLGNVFNCEQIAEAVGGEALRFFCVEHHYRSPVDFEVEEVRGRDGAAIGVRFRSLEAADRRLEKFYVTLQKIDRLVGPAPDLGAPIPEVDTLYASTREALSDDFNAPMVMAALHTALTFANRLLDETKGDKALRKRSLAQLAAALRNAGAAIGILGDDPAAYLAARRDRLVARNNVDVPRVQQLLADRAAARAAKDFTRADAVRNELAGLGIAVLDTPAGTDWTVQDAG